MQGPGIYQERRDYSMHLKRIFVEITFGVVTAVFILTSSAHAAVPDFGVEVEKALKQFSMILFGIPGTLDQSAPPTSGPYRTTSQTAEDQVLLAPGLHARYVTRNAADLTDQIVLIPKDNPVYMITCVEGARKVIGTNPDGSPKYNPSVQLISLIDGSVQTILRGMDRCDGIRETPWGSILATEETSDGGAYEIIFPLSVTNHVIVNRTTGEIRDPSGAISPFITKRTALPTIAWEGIVITPSGVVIGGDELRPGTGKPDADGGAIFKFIPKTLRTDNNLITDLSQSPWVAGNVYAMQVTCRNDKLQYGQGCEVGLAGWIPVNATTARSDANAKGATGYYRPEDMDQDRTYSDPNNPNAVRFCWTDTGASEAYNFAEVVCAVDFDANSPLSPVVAERFIEGDLEFNYFDNLAFQPGTNNLYVLEDSGVEPLVKGNDIFACLPDGLDRDLKSDGCVRILSLKDSSAEPTGFIFSPDGRTAYFSIQHSDDTHMPLVDDYPTDDIIAITGFQVPLPGSGR
jgi:hypothetical protein